ncbi:hypothetical protein H5410_029747, partial [Solanum commersonii]
FSQVAEGVVYPCTTSSVRVVDSLGKCFRRVKMELSSRRGGGFSNGGGGDLGEDGGFGGGLSGGSG